MLQSPGLSGRELIVNTPFASAMLDSALLSSDSTGETATVAGTVARLLRSGLEVLESDRETAAAIITNACALLENAANSRSALPPAIPGGLTSRQIRRIKSYVEDNLDGNISIARLSGVVQLGPSHFRRAFKKSLGISPHTFVVECRIRRAKQLMLETDQPLSEIALQAGFADQAHLTTRFHRVVGQTPAAWRRGRHC